MSFQQKQLESSTNVAQAASEKKPDDPETALLYECAISGKWDELSTLCDTYTRPSTAPEIQLNPLFAAVLHTAVVMAAKHKSTMLFNDVAPAEMVHALAINAQGADFCPFAGFDENEDATRARRKAIGKLCRTCPEWIALPLQDQFRSGGVTRGTTTLHLAVRMRNPSLVKLLLKYNPRAAQVQDELGYLPLHYAVCPVDEIRVYMKAIAVHNSRTNLNNNSLIAPADIPNMQNIDVGGGTIGGASYGMRMVNRGKYMISGRNDSALLGRYRVRRQIMLNKRTSNKWLNSNSGVGGSNSTCGSNGLNSTAALSVSNGGAGKTISNTNNDEINTARKSPRIKKINQRQQTKATQYLLFSDLYMSPSCLVRAMMFIGCVEEDSHLFIEAESQTSPIDYPYTADPRGIVRQSRPWKCEAHRIEVIRVLVDVYPEGMAVPCNIDDEVDGTCPSLQFTGGGGDTPLIMAVRTFKGGGLEEDGEEEFNMDMVNHFEGQDGNVVDGIIEQAVVAAAANAAGDANPAAPDGAAAILPNEKMAEPSGEEDANYEADILYNDGDAKRSTAQKKSSGASDAANIRPEVENVAPVNENENNQGIEAPAGGNNADQPNETLEALRAMIEAAARINDWSAFSRANQDGDTPLHMALRIGANRRLVALLLNAYPQVASVPGEGGATPLHLLLRRCSHLAPEGVGGLATYDAAVVQAMLQASGNNIMSLPNCDKRPPLHEAAYFGASPEVLDVLANTPGGREALLLRDNEHHTPLGAYCRHAADFYGIRTLVSHCPEAAAALGDGKRLPLHRLLASFNLAVNVDVLYLMGNAYPRGVNLKDSHNMTPLALLCQSYRGPMNVDIAKLLLNQTSLGRCLSNKVMLMARYLIINGKANRDYNSIQQSRGIRVKERLLHAALRDPASSEEIIQLATVIDPNQIKEVDEEGNTPLHLACFRESGCTEYTVSEEDLSASDDDSVYKTVNNGTEVDPDPLPLETSEGSGKRLLVEDPYDSTASFIPILHTVLKRDISAAQVRNNDGRYPFSVLVDRGASWGGGGIDQILKAYPAAIFSFNLNNAVVVAAMGRVSQPSDTPLGTEREEEALCLGAMFEMLKGRPTVLEGANIDMLEDLKKQGGPRQSKRLRIH